MHVATIDWDDGTIETLSLVQDTGGGLFRGSHVYLDGGIYDVVVPAASPHR